MPTLRLLVAMSGRDHSWSVGDLYTCDDTSAARLVAAGRAVVIDRAPDPLSITETAAVTGGRERAIRPRGKARG